MKILLLYLRILKRHDPDYPVSKPYEESSRRFLETYQKFKPLIPHELVVVNCGTNEHDSLFDGVAHHYESYDGGGFDCGTYQFINRELDADLVMGLNTHTYFWRSDWLEPFVEAFINRHPGVYGATASYQNHPHLRTPCIAWSPEVLRKYPHPCQTRDEACAFEAGNDNFSLWAYRKGYASLLVAGDGVYTLKRWRTAENIFRRGDQTNCLVWDRHTDVYRDSEPIGKKCLEYQADGV